MARFLRGRESLVPYYFASNLHEAFCHSLEMKQTFTKRSIFGSPTVSHRARSLLTCCFLLYSFVSGQNSSSADGYEVCQVDPDVLTGLYPTQFIDFPVDHFHNESRYAPHSNATFKNRYWYNDKYYAPGGPIIVANSGESAGVYSLNQIDAGLPGRLAKATNGIAVILEHRYYGDSFPVVPADPSSALTLEDYRFLTVEQAMADQAFFAQTVEFQSQKGLNLTASNAPFFAVGCS